MVRKMAQKYMATALLMIGLLALPGCGMIQVFDYKGNTASKSETGKIAAEVQSIEIVNKYGDVHIEETSGEASWSWDGKCWATKQSDADDFVADLELEVEQNGDKQVFRVKVPSRSRKLRGIQSDLTIQIPAQLAITVNNKHGDLTTHGIAGKVILNNKHGDVEVTSLSGQTSIDVKHGTVIATGLEGTTKINNEHGEVKVDGATGNLTVNVEHADAIIKNASGEVKTDSEHGDIEIQTSGSIVNCRSEHGDVEITLTSNLLDKIIADAEHSDVTVFLPADTAVQLDLDAEHGKVRSAFQDSNNAGAAKIKIRTEHGDIRIRKK